MNKFKGDIIVDSYEQKMEFEAAAFRCGYSVAIEPQSDEKFRMRFYITKEYAAAEK